MICMYIIKPVFGRLDTGVVGSNPTRGMDIRVYSVFVSSCIDSGLATVWSLVQGFLPTVYKIKILKWDEAFHRFSSGSNRKCQRNNTINRKLARSGMNYSTLRSECPSEPSVFLDLYATVTCNRYYEKTFSHFWVQLPEGSKHTQHEHVWMAVIALTPVIRKATAVWM
jgi:hypothetical protein